ncbi:MULTISPECIES: hypothetical protein [Paraburkholderia]|uniref:Uncharacterized protein n=2 Tax=Burkholderiaceae TaxID=119060 RepID=A0AAP5BJR7_9BURK|nr:MULTISPECIES: hypothetical protein [Paraburkholderia]MCX4150004.1 hypothetical protein [Paraburkholderia madseniana]MDN7152940.1 hypothetical protein [Paraburkholderia sp. WS6]MDQ6411822.1 hypothetical protein [Paraburkholderia madseniana]
MGATVTTGKCAAAFRSNEGELFYVLFERHYEKNVYPHDDHWSAFAFGTREEVFRRVFVGASDCCGGMLQSRSGEIKPENYIESWKQELNRPVQIRDVAVSLKFDQSWRAAVPEDSCERVADALNRAGFADRFETIRNGGIDVTLYDDTALLHAIYGVNGELSPWRIFTHSDTGTLPIDVPAVRNVAAREVEIPSIHCYAIDRDVRLVAGENGEWSHGQWAYSALASFVTGTALERELVQPGFAKTTIPAVREALNDAAPLPGDSRITVRRTACKKDYQQSDVDELARGLGLIREGDQAPDEFTFSFSDIKGEDADRVRYRVGSMRDALTWHVPETSSAETVPPAPATQGQLSF